MSDNQHPPAGRRAAAPGPPRRPGLWKATWSAPTSRTSGPRRPSAGFQVASSSSSAPGSTSPASSSTPLELIGYDPETDTSPPRCSPASRRRRCPTAGTSGATGQRRSPGTIRSRLATASGSPGSTCWSFAQAGSPGSPASSTLTCIGISGCSRNCPEAVPARSDEFRRGRVSQCSIAVTPVSDPSGKAPAILIGRVVWAVAERKHRNDPER